MVIGFVIRSGLLVGAIYYTKKAGVWGSPNETEKLYNDIKNEIRPYMQVLEKKMPFDFPALPQTGELCFVAKHYYNEGVKKSFNFIEMLPCYTGQMIKIAKNKFEEFGESPRVSN